MENKKCSIGLFKNEICSEEKFINCKDFSDEDQITLNSRSGTDVSFICSQHDKQYRIKYTSNQKSCADPFKLHDSIVRKSLRPVSLKLFEQCKIRLPSIIPGSKLCISCTKRVYSELPEHQNEVEIFEKTVNVEESQLVESVSEDSVSKSSKPSETPDQVGTPILIQSLVDEKMSSNLSENLQLSNVTISTSEMCSSTGETFTPTEIHLDRLNSIAKIFNLSPVKKKDLDRSKTYAQQKYHEMTSKLQSCFEHLMENDSDTIKNKQLNIDDTPELTGKEIINQLKEKFNNCSKVSEKLQILSVLPLSWSTEKIVDVFEASTYMVKKVKQKVSEDGILFTPQRNKGHSLLKTTEEKIQQFYRNQDVSRELPGKKEFKSVHENGQRVPKQKRLILGNLNEIYQLFKQKYPFEKVSFSKFASLRPPECVLAGSSGTHVVCVCLIHENFKLSFHGAKLDKLKCSDESQPFSSYRDCLKMVICPRPTSDCYLGTCSNCPGSTKLRRTIENIFNDNFVDEITYKQWTQVDRCSLETIVKSTDDFVDNLVESIPKFLQHDFIARQQAEFFQTTKKNLEVGQVLVVADFSENYSFLLQNSVQGAYWNNSQATIHPFACYYRSIDENVDNIVPLNLIIISDNLTHNTTAVYSFQEVLTSFLKNKIPDISKIIYFSDGAASQYKNRYNLLNLLHHEEDFQIPAEWHYFATSHGKGPSDGLGGTLKRKVDRANLQSKADDQIQTPDELFQWAKENVHGINCDFVSNEQIQRTQKKLNQRFKNALPVQGIRNCHAAIPISSDVMRVKTSSSSEEGKDFQLKNTDIYEFVEEPDIKSR